MKALSKRGVTLSQAIQMLVDYVADHGGLPPELVLDELAAKSSPVHFDSRKAGSGQNA